MSSALYAVGYLLVIVVVSYLAYLSHIPEPYIVAIVVIMLGIGVVSGIENAREKDLKVLRDRPLPPVTLGMWIPLRSSFWILGRSIRSLSRGVFVSSMCFLWCCLVRFRWNR